MFYWGFGFLVLAITALAISIAGAPGLGPLINVALLMTLVLSVAGVLTVGHRRYHFYRHAHR
jgi:hypothetical protein